MLEQNKRLSELYAKFEKLKTEIKERQDQAKELKDEMIYAMEEMGRDEVVVMGLDEEAVMLMITYPEREVLNKKALAEALGIPQKELSKPQVMVQLTLDGKLTEDLLEEYTETEERMQFSAKAYKEEPDA